MFMKINQVEELVGITKKNIRFYEDQGLISPDRNPENGYREYNLSDVKRLNQIKLLRQLDVPIEQIRMLQSGKISMTQCMEAHSIRLSHRQHELETIKEICMELSNEKADINELDPSEYFSKMKTLEEGGVRFVNVSKGDIKKRKIGPIISVSIIVVYFLVIMALGIWASSADPQTPVWFMVIFFSVATLVIVGILVALRMRLKEIDGGEIDEACKY